jgi:two-component system, OmpR family, response regulator
VRIGDESVALTPTEFRVLAALAARPGKVLRRGELVAAAWPDGAIVHDNTLDAYIARIRRKLREAGAPQAVETVRGVGYTLR